MNNLQETKRRKRETRTQRGQTSLCKLRLSSAIVKRTCPNRAKLE